MYADDLVILSETSTGLQNCLTNLHDYTMQWDLQINISKTKIMVFQNVGRKVDNIYTFGHQILEKTKNYKYLGTTISNTGNFKMNESNLKKKGLRASYIITKNITSYSKPSTAIKIFERMIEPILTYNCEIAQAYLPKTWDYTKFKQNMWEIGDALNKVSLGFLRQLLGVHKKTTSMAIHAETGKKPISIKIFVLIIKYWLRLSTCENGLLVEVQKLNLEQDENRKQNWMRIIKYLLQITNMQEIKPSDCSKENNKLAIKFQQKINLAFEEWWKSQGVVTGESKLDFYYKYKKTFTYEKYLDNVPRYIRIHITRLRVSSHILPTGTGTSKCHAFFRALYFQKFDI